MAGDFVKAQAFVLGILLAGVGTGWALAEFAGPRDPIDDEPVFPDEPEILVLYPSHEVRLTTDRLAFDNQGRITFTPIIIDLENISKLSIIMHVEMQGAAPKDQFDLHVTAPDAASRDAEIAGPSSVSGYKLSQTAIDQWPRKVTPRPQTYTTHDAETALTWSAENHTDRKSTGPWGAVLSVTPPGLSASPRNGEAWLEFVMTAYEAVAFPQWTPDDLESLENDTAEPESGADDDNGTADAAPGEAAGDGARPAPGSALTGRPFDPAIADDGLNGRL